MRLKDLKGLGKFKVRQPTMSQEMQKLPEPVITHSPTNRMICQHELRSPQMAQLSAPGLRVAGRLLLSRTLCSNRNAAHNEQQRKRRGNSNGRTN
jgi:hypothetical protein